MADDGFQPFAIQSGPADDGFKPFGVQTQAKTAPAKTVLPKHVRASEAAGTRTPDDSYGSRFGAAATRSLLGNPGGIQMLADPASTIHALAPNEFGIPHGAIDNFSTVGSLLTGDPEAWGNLLPQLPFMAMGAGEHGLPSIEQATRAASGAVKGAYQPDPELSQLSHYVHLNRLPFIGKLLDYIPAPMVGNELGRLAGQHFPMIGGEGLADLGQAAGTAYPIVRGAVRGAKQGLKEYRTPPDLPPQKLLGPSSVFNMPGVPDPSGPMPFTPPESWSQPASGPIKPVTPDVVDISQDVGSPVPSNVARFKHDAPHSDLIRQNHAAAADLNLKHTDLSKAAKAVYGVESYSHLSYPQLTALHEYMLKNKTLPTSPRDLLPE